jgi:hypothetical protein
VPQASLRVLSPLSGAGKSLRSGLFDTSYQAAWTY